MVTKSSASHSKTEVVAYLHLVEELPRLKSIRKANHGRSIHESYSIRSLIFPSNKRFKKPNFFQFDSWQFTSFYNNNFEMAAGHVVSRMIFQAITADRNARIRALPNRRVSGKPQSTAKIPPDSARTRLESQQDGLLHVLLSP